MPPRTKGVGLTNIDDATTDPTASDDSTKGYEVLSSWANIATDRLWRCLDASLGAAVWRDVTTAGGPVSFDLTIGGCLAAANLPLLGAGAEIVDTAATLVTFQGRRGAPETSGTTTVQLELNGTLVGTPLSWTSADVVNTLKTAIINVPVLVGDLLTLRLTSAGVDAADLYMEASSAGSAGAGDAPVNGGGASITYAGMIGV